MAGCRSTLSISKIKVKFLETKLLSFYKTLGLTGRLKIVKLHCIVIVTESSSSLFVFFCINLTFSGRGASDTSLEQKCNFGHIFQSKYAQQI